MKKIAIKSIRKLDGTYKVCDLQVPNSNHYLLENKVVTHNSGGGGLKYAASTIVYLSKSNYKEGDEVNDKAKGREVIGVKLTAYMEKSRFTKYGKSIELLLHHDTGLDRYWGLFDLGLKRELIINNGKTYTFPDGQTGTRREIVYNPAKFFDPNMAAFENLCNREFRFGKNEILPSNVEDELEETPES
jgi:hypothetical protein